MRILFLVVFVLVNFADSFAQTAWVRYNQAGYESCRPFKRVIVISNANISGTVWNIKNSAGATVLTGNLGASLTSVQNDWTSKSYSYEVDFSTINTLGNYTFIMTGVTTVTLKIKDNPYEFFLDRAVRYFKVHRSGTTDCLDHAISHTGDASCAVYKRTGAGAPLNGTANWTLSAAANIDMQGGWYDAGDYIKFTQTVAYACYNLLRAYEVNPAIFNKKLYSITSYVDVVDESRHGLEYLMKTMPAGRPGEFVIQVGGANDHNQGNRLPENDALNGTRPCYSALSRTQMGLTVAALALGAKTFNALGNTTDGTRYRSQAITIFAQAEAAFVANAWWEGGGEVFYQDGSQNENMALAAYELWALTGTASYLTKAINYANTQGQGGWASWGDTEMLNNWRLYSSNATCANNLRGDLTSFKANSVRAGNIWRLPHDFTWGTLYSEIDVANAAALYQLQNNTSDAQYNNMYWDVMDYTFGQNNWGQAMIAEPSANLPFAITTSYSQYYKMQPGLWPIGEIVQGPCDKGTHDGLGFGYPTNQHNPTASANSGVFYEYNTDYATIETTIGGVSDAILMFALAQKMAAPCATLPVSLLDFTAVLNQQQVDVNWTTAKEVDSKEFVVQRSVDGINFDDIHTQVAAGNSSQTLYYSYLDLIPLTGESYYRLKQIDLNDAVTYSNLVLLINDITLDITVFPNPSSSVFNGSILSSDKIVTVTVCDVQGSVLSSFQQNTNEVFELGKNLAQGVYIMTIQDANKVYRMKMIKN